MTLSGDVLTQASKWIGYAEDPPGSNNTIFGKRLGVNYSPWCASFVSCVCQDAGFNPAAGESPWSVAVMGLKAWGDANGRTFTTPQRGDIALFWFPTIRTRYNHTGFVETVNADGTFNTIEGNTDTAGGRTGGQVMRHARRARTFFRPTLFVRPFYAPVIQTPTVAPAPTSRPETEDEMTIIMLVDESPAEWITNGISRRWLQDGTERENWVNAGVKRFEHCNVEQLRRIPIEPGTPVPTVHYV